MPIAFVERRLRGLELLYRTVHGLLAFATLILNINAIQRYTVQHSTTRNRLVEKVPSNCVIPRVSELSTMTARNNRGTQV